jgi:cephalosporin hydroxylase
MTLAEISKEFKLYDPPCYCDKEYSRHSYLSGKYDEILLPYKDLPVYLLEIGVYNGGSLVLWHKYFSKATIHALELVDRRCEEAKNLDRVEFIVQDAYFPSTYNSIPDKYYDIIIEDGSHFIDHQVGVVKNYASKVNDGGVLIVEDIHGEDNLFRCYKAAIEAKFKTVEVYDAREKTGIYDEIMLICKK